MLLTTTIFHLAMVMVTQSFDMITNICISRSLCSWKTGKKKHPSSIKPRAAILRRVWQVQVWCFRRWTGSRHGSLWGPHLDDSLMFAQCLAMRAWGYHGIVKHLQEPTSLQKGERPRNFQHPEPRFQHHPTSTTGRLSGATGDGQSADADGEMPSVTKTCCLLLAVLAVILLFLPYFAHGKSTRTIQNWEI